MCDIFSGYQPSNEAPAGNPPTGGSSVSRPGSSGGLGVQPPDGWICVDADGEAFLLLQAEAPARNSRGGWNFTDVNFDREFELIAEHDTRLTETLGLRPLDAQPFWLGPKSSAPPTLRGLAERVVREYFEVGSDPPDSAVAVLEQWLAAHPAEEDEYAKHDPH